MAPELVEKNWGKAVEEGLKEIRRGKLELVEEKIGKLKDELKSEQAKGFKCSTELQAWHKKKERLNQLEDLRKTQAALIESEPGLISDEEAEKILRNPQNKLNLKRQSEKPN